jgi:catechol 2,3-dioxygenase-like lactoylglutathione lyase family enzyme
MRTWAMGYADILRQIAEWLEQCVAIRLVNPEPPPPDDWPNADRASVGSRIDWETRSSAQFKLDYPTLRSLPRRPSRSGANDPVSTPAQNLERAMVVKRIVMNIAASQVDTARSFYGDILGLDVVMDLGWIITFASRSVGAVPQISIASEGGSGTPVPDVSIEVDDLDEVLERAEAGGLSIEYGPVQEPWGVTRCYVRDPFGRLINILEHTSSNAD